MKFSLSNQYNDDFVFFSPISRFQWNANLGFGTCGSVGHQNLGGLDLGFLIAFRVAKLCCLTVVFALCRG